MTGSSGSPSSPRPSSSSVPSRDGHSHRRRRRRTRIEVDAGRGRMKASFDGVTEGLIYALLAFSPLAFGAGQAWSSEVFLLLIASATAVVSVKHVARAWAGQPAGYRWSWAYPLMLAFLALCVAQTLPLPAAWVAAVSPGTIALKTELLSDLPDVGTLLRRLTISFYPKATVQHTVLTAAVAALFAVALDVFRDPPRIRRLLSVIAAVGLVVAGLAAYQNLSGATTIYGVVPAGHRNAGPFFNYSHFSQFMNMSIGAALALLLDRTAELSEFYRTPGEIWAALRQPRNAAVWAWAVLCVAGPIVILLSMSRMGMISLGVATVVSGAMLFWRGNASGAGTGRAWLVVGMALAVFAVLLFVGFDVVSSRLATLHDTEVSGGGRQEILRDLVGEYKRFPLVGTGLGTHEFVFGLFDTRHVPTMATHAENEYAQLMEETGLVGALLAGGFLAGLVVSYARAVRRPTRPIDYAAFGLGFGLIAILVHSGSDFGQHMPANAALTAIYIALLTRLARRRPHGQPAPPPTPPRRRALPVIGLALVACAVFAAGVAVGLWADRARAAESLWSTAWDRASDLGSNGWHGTDAEFADLMAPATAAVALEPGDVEYRYWTDTYRWFADIPHTTDPKTQLDIVQPADLPAVRRLVDDLNGDRLLCPTYGPPLSVLGQLNRDVLGQPALGGRQLRLAYRLAPYTQTICLLAGLQALVDQQWDEATRVLANYMQLNGSIETFADACINRSQPQIPYRILMDTHNRGGLLYLASRIPTTDPRWVVWATACRKEADKLLAAEAARPDAPPSVFAELAGNAAQAGRTGEAIDLYRKALAGEYGNVGWRMALAHCLADAGHPAEAAREARVVLQLRPEVTEAKDLAAECEAKAATNPSR